jgi:hypothetical protein
MFDNLLRELEISWRSGGTAHRPMAAGSFPLCPEDPAAERAYLL